MDWSVLHILLIDFDGSPAAFIDLTEKRQKGTSHRIGSEIGVTTSRGSNHSSFDRISTSAVISQTRKSIYATTSSPWTSMATLLLMPLILGLFINIASGSDGSMPIDRSLLCIIAGIWLGMNQACREIVKEKRELSRELLRISPVKYLSSKALYFIPLLLIQSLLLFTGAGLGKFAGLQAELAWNSYGDPGLIIAISIFASLVSGVSLGLFISSACLHLKRNAEVSAVLISVIITLPQMLFSSKVIPGGLVDKPQQYYSFDYFCGSNHTAEALSYLTASRYLHLPVDAVAHRFSPSDILHIIVFNYTVVISSVLVLAVLTWLILVIFRHRSSRNLEV